MRLLLLLASLACAHAASSATSSALSLNGQCYDTKQNAYNATSCLTSDQVLQDTSRTTACRGVAMANGTYYCPSIFQCSGAGSALAKDTCYLTPALAVQYTPCALSQILTSSASAAGVPTGVCTGAPGGVLYYCPASATATTFLSGNFLTSNGVCYSSTSSAAAATGCTPGQVASDATGTGLCLGAPAGVTFYCPAVLSSPAVSQANINKCSATVQAQFAASNASRAALAISSGSCQACSSACPTAFGSVTEGNDPKWWLCLAGGRTSTIVSASASATVTFCTVHPSTGFWCVVLIPPILVSLVGVYFCYANRTSLADRARSSFSRKADSEVAMGALPAGGDTPPRRQELLVVANPLKV